MAAQKDLYEILGLSKGADEKSIKSAYRKLAKKYHPDTNPGNKTAEEHFKDVTYAYSILSDPGKKDLYDKYGFIGLQEGFDENAWKQATRQSHYKAGQGYGQGYDQGYGQRYNQGFSHGFHQGFRQGGDSNTTWHFTTGDGTQQFHFTGSDMDMDDIFGSFFGNQFQSQNRREEWAHRTHKAPDPEPEAPDTQDIQISFREAALGADKRIRLLRGDGQIQDLQIHIPAGIEDAQSLRLKGKGSNGTDLHLRIHILEEKGWSRKGLDVYQEVEIPYTTAVLGGKSVINTLQGKVEVNIPAGTACGQKLKIRGKGIQDRKNPTRKGDTYAVIKISVPKKISKEAAEKLKAYQYALG